jgi:hypothetical protein
MSNKPTSAERPHHQFGPSGLKLLEMCAGYRSDPNKDPHPVTEAGSRCHDALETGDDSLLQGDDEHALVAMVRRWEAKNVPADRGVDIREPRLHIGDLTYGYADRLIIRKHQAWLIDYKFGYEPVERAEENLQGMAYTLGVFEAYPHVQAVRVVFLQPRLDYVTTCVWERSQSTSLLARIARVISRAKADRESDRVAGYLPCLYCGRKADCPTLGRIAARVAKTYEPSLDVPDVVHPSQVTDGQTMAKLMDLQAVLADFVESVKFHAARMVQETDQEVEGYVLATRSGRRQIVDPLAALEVAKRFGLSLEDFLAAAKPSVSDLEVGVRAAAANKQKGKQVERFNDALREADALVTHAPTQFLKRAKSPVPEN